jgi:U3 small nucleolar RNA-associated protein 7
MVWSQLSYQGLPDFLMPLPENVPKHAHIANPKLRSELTRQSAHAARSKALLKDAELLLTEDAGRIEVEGEMEKTWRIGQDEIARSAGQEATKGRREWKLEGGPYKSRYSRNGRFVTSVTFH